jgi:predicted TPR repeat methyltransferase
LTGNETAYSSGPPEGYVTGLFDFYAQNGYEDHVLNTLNYTAHKAIFEAVRLCYSGNQWDDVKEGISLLDLGLPSTLPPVYLTYM